MEDEALKSPPILNLHTISWGQENYDYDQAQSTRSAELATLRRRVDVLEARTADLEANQFSTTTKLVGEAIFAVTDNFGSGDNNKTVFLD